MLLIACIIASAKKIGYPTHEDDYQKAIEDIHLQTGHYSAVYQILTETF